jgi:hypothetical protein
VAVRPGPLTVSSMSLIRPVLTLGFVVVASGLIGCSGAEPTAPAPLDFEAPDGGRPSPVSTVAAPTPPVVSPAPVPEMPKPSTPPTVDVGPPSSDIGPVCEEVLAPAWAILDKVKANTANAEDARRLSEALDAAVSTCTPDEYVVFQRELLATVETAPSPAAPPPESA